MFDITLGQYYPASSPIHRLDPRTKLKAVFLYVLALFLVTDLAGYALVACFLATIVAISKIPASFVLKSLRPIFLIIFLTVLVNLFWTQGETVFSFWIFKISREGIDLALTMGVRLVLLISGSSLLTLSTTTVDLTDGIEQLMNRIPLLRRVSHEVGMMMSIALSFIPTLMEETDRIVKAQKSRGADFDTGNFARRAKAMIPILVPLFISAIQRANELAMAMESRCYTGGENRTRLKALHYAARDHIAMAILVFVMGAAYLARYIP